MEGSSITLSAFCFPTNGSLDFTFGIILFHRLPFVVQFLSFAQTHHTFGDPSIRKVETQRDQGQATFFGSTCELQELATVNQ
jgi:hypothetical protein